MVMTVRALHGLSLESDRVPETPHKNSHHRMSLVNNRNSREWLLFEVAIRSVDLSSSWFV